MRINALLPLILCAALSCSWATAVQAQSTTAKAVLDQVSKKYDGYRTIMADFRFEAQQEDGQTYSDAGSLKLDKSGNQYRIKLDAQEIISNGKSVWSILPEDREVQVSEVDHSAGTLGPQNLFTFYRTGYSYTKLSDERFQGQPLKVIDLTPTDQASSYAKIKVRINTNNHIHDISVRDKSGARYTYTVTALYVNQSIPAGTFNFSKNQYKGFEIVDLR